MLERRSGLPQLIAFLAEADVTELEGVVLESSQGRLLLSPRTIAVKLVALPLSIVSGLAIGREGGIPACVAGLGQHAPVCFSTRSLFLREEYRVYRSNFCRETIGPAVHIGAGVGWLVASAALAHGPEEEEEEEEGSTRSPGGMSSTTTTTTLPSLEPALEDRDGPALEESVRAGTVEDGGLTHTLVTAGGGAGFAAAFNAPLAGILYMLEEVTMPSSWSARATRGAFVATASAVLCIKAIVSISTSTARDSYHSLVVGIGSVEQLSWSVVDLVPFLVHSTHDTHTHTPGRVGPFQRDGIFSLSKKPFDLRDEQRSGDGE